MKRWIALITATTYCFSSTLTADGVPPAEHVVETSSEPIATEAPTQVEESPAAVEPYTERTSVGKAAEDGSNTASDSRVGTYLLAAGAIAAGILALILVSRHSGHHKH